MKSILLLAALFCELLNTGDKVGHEKWPSRWLSVTALFDELLGMQGFSLAEAKSWLATHTDEEKKKVLDFMQEKFDIQDDKLELLLEKGLILLGEHVDLIEKDIAFVKALKA
jgi:DNA-binding transcriptional MerR regulator